jgi:chemotaxis family two-component system response regulator Rcp1
MGTLLIVEDNPGDERLLTEALRAANCRLAVEVVRDGEQALNYLRQQGAYVKKPPPSVIILDLNLPRRDGREILVLLKGSREWNSIPVIVFTTSRNETDLAFCYSAYANCVLIKPCELDHFFETVRAIKEFWLDRVQLPAKIPLPP